MSGTGKSTVLIQLARRGHPRAGHGITVAGFLPDGTWDEPRMWAFLNSEDSVLVSGTVENQGHFYTALRHVVLLSAPLPGGRDRGTHLAGRTRAGPAGECVVRWPGSVADLRSIDGVKSRPATSPASNWRGRDSGLFLITAFLAELVAAYRGPPAVRKKRC